MIRRTRLVTSSIAFIAALGAIAAARSSADFKAGRAAEYAHQSSDQVTIGAKAYDKPELIAQAFGKKTDLLKYGVLPVLVVIENDRSKTLDLRDMEVNLVAADGRHAPAVNPEDIPFLGNPRRGQGTQVPMPVPLPRKRNPLTGPEIVSRAFAAKMLPPGDSASGFFYFEAKPERGDKLYLNGLRETPSGQDILYFEFPLANNRE